MPEKVEGLVRTEELEWVDMGGGNAMKVLRVSEETGAWSALIKAPAGQTNSPHKHLGPADFYVLKGAIEYRNGVAKEGDWIYEPAGAVHEATHHPVDTIYLANVHGPIANYNEDGSISSVSDWQSMKTLMK